MVEIKPFLNFLFVCLVSLIWVWGFVLFLVLFDKIGFYLVQTFFSFVKRNVIAQAWDVSQCPNI